MNVYMYGRTSAYETLCLAFKLDDAHKFFENYFFMQLELFMYSSNPPLPWALYVESCMYEFIAILRVAIARKSY